MEENVEQVLEGAKPSQIIVKIAQDEINKLDLPLGGEAIIMEERHPIKDIGHAMYLMGHMAALEVTLVLLKIDQILVKHKGIVEDIKYLIPYWYARGWIEPLNKYGNPLIKTKEDSFLRNNYRQQYLMGAKPDPATLDMIRSYMDFTMFNLVFPGDPFLMTAVHGVGPVSRNISPVKRFNQLIRACGAKLAKEHFNLRNLHNEREIQQLYDNCFHILLFWTMKGWLKIPDLDGKDHADMIPKVKVKEPIPQLDKKTLIQSFNFGFGNPSNDEIRFQYNIFHGDRYRSGPNYLTDLLTYWLYEQIEERGKTISYIDVYKKSKEFVQLFF